MFCMHCGAAVDGPVTACAACGQPTQARSLTQAEVKIVRKQGEKLPPIMCDPAHMQQAFLNILMNAVDACVMGEGMVTVYGRIAGDGLSVSVADNGCGMEPDELARCMDLFFTNGAAGSTLYLARLGEGDFFGEVSMLTGKPRTATITASQPTQVLRLDKSKLDTALARYPGIRKVLDDFYKKRAEHTVEAMIETMKKRR